MSALLGAVAQLLWGWVLISTLALVLFVVRAHCIEARHRRAAQRPSRIPRQRS